MARKETPKSPQELKRQEADLVRLMLERDGTTWTWLKGHLEKQRMGLQMVVGDPRITQDHRTLLCGQLAVIAGILDTPSRLLTILEEAQAAIEAPAPYQRPPARPLTPTKV